MTDHREEVDLVDALKQRVAAGEAIFITGAGSQGLLVATIEDLAREAGRTVRVVQINGARVVQFDVSPEADGGELPAATRAIAPKP